MPPRIDYRSNVDFVHFIWDNFEWFSTRKFAITILPSDNIAAPLNLSSALPSSTKLFYLKYYRVLSDGLCLDKRNCNRCMVKNRLSLQMLCCCRRSEGDCSVLLVRDNLPPYVTSVPICISVTCVSLHSLHPRLSVNMWMLLFPDVCLGNASFLLFSHYHYLLRLQLFRR